MSGQTVRAIIAAGQSPLLDAVPLEIRYKIYGFASQRPNGPYLILKEYLEKKDPDIEPPAPPANIDITGEEEEEGEGESDEEEDEHDGEEIQEDGTEDIEVHNDQDMVNQDHVSATPALPVTTSSNAPTIDPTAVTSNPHVIDEDEDMDSEEEESADNDNEDENEDEAEPEENDDDEEEEEDGTTTPIASPSLPPPTGRNTKYRHILPTIQLSQCPPPVSLLQTCTQLRNEALNDFLNTCSLDINVSQSFQHQSFFLETMDQLVDHPFSPLEQMRKINLTIFWDSEWLASKLSGSPPEIETSFFFEFYLGDRIQKIVDLLRASPDLRSITVNWHDSERTPASEAFMNEKLVTFLSLTDKEWADPQTGVVNNVDVSCTEHFSATGTAHAQGSAIGNLRHEFDSLLASGMRFR